MCTATDRVKRYEGEKSSFITGMRYLPLGSVSWEGSHIKESDYVVEMTVRRHRDANSAFKDLTGLLFKNKMRAFIDNDEPHTTTFRLAFFDADSAQAFMMAMFKYIESGEGNYKAFLTDAGVSPQAVSMLKKEVTYQI